MLLPGFNDNFLPARPLLIGFSGGVDSAVLTDVLCRAGSHPVAAAHLNHGIRGAEADADADFCREFCKERQIPFFTAKVDVPARARAARRNLEDAARAERQAFFARLCNTHGFAGVILAHHADDQAETVFMRLLRRAGWQGLGGMAASAALSVDAGTLQAYRPLLEVTRESIINYAMRRNLRWREDSSNNDVGYARNWLRKRFFPVLRDIFPDYRERLLAFAATARRNAAQVRAWTIRPEWGGYFLPMPAANTDDIEGLVAALTRFLPPPRRDSFREISSVVSGERHAVNLPHGWQFRRENDGYFARPAGDPARLWEPRTFAGPPFTMRTPFFLINAEQVVCGGEIPEKDNPRVEYLNPTALRWPLEIRPPRAGESMLPLGADAPRKLTAVYNDHAVPERCRGVLPVLADRAGILWAAPLRPARRAALDGGTAAVRVSFSPA